MIKKASNMKDLVAYQDDSVVSKEIIKKPTGTVSIITETILESLNQTITTGNNVHPDTATNISKRICGDIR
jgi:hypothetical protein